MAVEFALRDKIEKKAFRTFLAGIPVQPPGIEFRQMMPPTEDKGLRLKTAGKELYKSAGGRSDEGANGISPETAQNKRQKQKLTDTNGQYCQGGLSHG
jgi:hypothetical protein